MIRNKKSQNQSIFVAFVDMEKAFDRNPLLYKMMKFGFGGKLSRCNRSIYDSNKTFININGYILLCSVVSNKVIVYLSRCFIRISMMW